MGLFEGLSVDVLNALRDAGVSITAMVILGIIVWGIVRATTKNVTDNTASDNKRWEDFMTIWRANQTDFVVPLLSDIKEILKELRAGRKDQDTKTNEAVAKIDKRFDSLEEGIRHLHTDMQQVKDAIIK